MKTLFLVFVLLLPGASYAQERQALNILFFGNSLTGVNQVYNLVADVSQVAGNTRPVVFAQILNGKTLSDHLKHSGTMSKITQSLPANETWDFVVIQEQSYKPSTVGMPNVFRKDAVALFDLVLAHSPNVYGIMFENWARNEGGWPYPPYVKIADMMADIRAATSLARDDIHLNTGKPNAGVAPIGSAWENFDWQGLHTSDRVHATKKGSLLAALVIYRRIYLDDTSDITAAQASGLINKLGLSPKDWTDLTQVADITDEAPAPMTYLYVIGHNKPGGAIKLKVTGEVNASPVGVWLGSGKLNTPLVSDFGLWHLLFPVAGPVLLPPIPSDNSIVFKATLPPSPPGPYIAHLQALVGKVLSNYYLLEVE